VANLRGLLTSVHEKLKITIDKDLRAQSLLMFAVLSFGFEIVAFGHVPFFRDLGTYFYPMRFSLAESFQAGELPLWNRHVAMGYPLLANFQSGVFYPLHLFYLIFPFFTATGVIFLLHYMVAASGAYLLCRSWNYPPYIALIGGLLYTFGGTVVSLTNVMNHFQTAVWLPWVLLAGENAFRSGSGRHLLLLTLVLTVQFLAGSPEFFAMSVLILFADGLRVSAAQSPRTYARVVWVIAAATCLVGALAMAQILPTVELILESRGRTTVSIAQASSWSLHPLNLINLFFLERQIDPEYFTSPKLFFLNKTPFLLSNYIGAVSLFGIALWFLYSDGRKQLLLLGVLTLALALALGAHTPIHGLVYRYLPFFNLFRFPEKFFFLSYVLLLFVAVEGLYRFHRDDTPPPRKWVGLFLVASIPAITLLAFRLKPEWLTKVIAWLTSTSTSGLLITKASAVLVNFERQAALIIALALLLVLGKRLVLRPLLFQSLLVVLVFIDLSSAHRSYQYFFSPDFVHSEARLLNSPNSSPHRLFYLPAANNPHPSFYALPKEPTFEAFNRLVFANLLPNTGVFHGVDYMQEIDALARWPYIEFLRFASKLPPERLYRLLGNLNVRHINSFHALNGDGLALVDHFPEFPAWLYAIRSVTPRVSIVSKIAVEKDPTKILERLSSPEFDSLAEVILEKSLPHNPTNNFTGTAELIHYGNQDIRLKASLNGFGILVLADTFYPGWRVYVNGREEEILRANLFFRAVALSSGEHSVEFRYQPRSFAIGVIVSLVTLGGIVIGVVSAVFRGKPWRGLNQSPISKPA
jgi:hypothetical protein